MFINLIKYNHKYNKRFGFTIVELLVVIVVIGILATITIISYTGISQRATVASLQSDLDNVYKKFKMHQIENSGYPTTIDCTQPVSISITCIRPSSKNQFILSVVDNTVPSNQIFCITVQDSSQNTKYHIDQSGTQASGACPYYLTLIASTGGVVNSNINGPYSTGSVQTITATPNSDYVFNNWTGDTGCAGVASHTITINANKTCTANFGPMWIPGIAATPMAGKYVRAIDLGSTYVFSPSQTELAAPQAAVGLDPYYPSLMSLVSPQTNPGVDFSGYPAQNACKAVGGRLPNSYELQTAIYPGRASYGNNFVSSNYFSATQSGAYYVFATNFGNGQFGTPYATSSGNIRCVKD